MSIKDIVDFVDTLINLLTSLVKSSASALYHHKWSLSELGCIGTVLAIFVAIGLIGKGVEVLSKKRKDIKESQKRRGEL